MNEKVLIYQVFTRLYGNRNENRVEWGTLADNGTGKMADFDAKTLKHIKQMGFSHIWYTGIIRHASQTDYSKKGIPTQHPDVVKGVAGSPYAICDYYDIDPDLAKNVNKRMEEFEALVKRTHKAGLKMIIDFVPNHVARQYQSVAKPEGVVDLGANDNKDWHFSTGNNFYYCWGQPLRIATKNMENPYTEEPAKATGNDVFSAEPGVNDWYETVKLNYGVDYCDAGGRSEHFDPIPDTWNKMTDILMFWASKGVDGFRCDMAEMVPAAFWAWATDKVKFQYPDLKFIGEVYNPAEYRNYIHAGFDYLYDKVGMYDCMRAVTCGNAPAYSITQNWQSVDDIADHMLYFLENHDEQRIGSDFFAGNGCKGIPAMVASVLMKSSPFMLYAAEEYGEKGMDKEGFSGKDGRTTIFDYWSIDTLCRAAKDELTDEERYIYVMHEKVLRMAANEKAVDGLFYDLMYVNPSSADFNPEKQYAFLRKNGNEMLLVVVNFDDKDVNIKVNIADHAFDWLQIPECDTEMTDIITGYTSDCPLRKGTPVEMEIPERGARVWKFTF